VLGTEAGELRIEIVDMRTKEVAHSATDAQEAAIETILATVTSSLTCATSACYALPTGS